MISTVALTACGGGSGSSTVDGSTTDGGTTDQPSRGIVPEILTALENLELRSEVLSATRRFPVAMPGQSSVTQSSSNDKVEVSSLSRPGSNQHDITIRNTVIGATWDEFSLNAISTDVVVAGETFGLIRHSIDIPVSTTDETLKGKLYLNVFTDPSADIMDDTEGGTDYEVGGYWLYLPEVVDDDSPVEVGAFYDNNEELTPTSYLTTMANATYSGIATEFYLDNGGAGTIGTTETYDSLVILNATFGTQPTIRGTITYESGDFITLKPAGIIAENGGFFTGDTSYNTIAGSNFPDSTGVGKWGGRLYEGQADKIAGTYSVNYLDPNFSEFEGVSIGIFVAEKDKN